ncbi:hypothetical protein ACH4U7_43000 [Streptomyces sp. NPDC020845]|uniref:hypothetical protein n=1 Tax=Streptomyces sp. NPDC020845 TaxID=3365096 RepID=UPI0037A0F00B
MPHGPWRAEWTFISETGVTTGTAHTPRYVDIRTAVFKAADESRRDLSYGEAAERDGPWKLLVAALYSEAMLTADELGAWQYVSPDGWANVTIRFTP